MIYVDTSVLVALHVAEADSERALTWFERHAQTTFIYSDWSDLEVASALSRKVRSGRMSSAERLRAEQAFLATKRETFRHVSITSEHFQMAEMMVKEHESGLRSGDALHLAIASTYGATLATLDRTLASASGRFGVAVESLT